MMDEIKVEMIPPAHLAAYQNNSRTHSDDQIKQIEASILEFGFTNPVLIDASRTVIAGHARVEAARSLGIEAIPCITLSHMTEAQIRAYVIADNKLAENAGWDLEILKKELLALKQLDFNIDLLGFGPDDLDALLSSLDQTDGLTDPDEVPDLPSGVPETALGDLWQMGRHRLLCGDCTKPENLARLMAGEKVGMIFTDPPYNVDYKGGTAKGLTIKNDKMRSSEFYQFLLGCFSACARMVEPGTPIYVCHADIEAVNFRQSLADAGWIAKYCILWVKNHFTLGRSDYHLRHEPIIYGWKGGGPHRWYGGRKENTAVEEGENIKISGDEKGAVISFSDGVRFIKFRVPSYEIEGDAGESQTSVWKINKPIKNEDHPTIKPVAIPQRAILNSSRNGDIVLDMFLGSGTTLIACEQTGRTCYGLELDERYCDVIVKRWEDFTGKKAQKVIP